MAALRLRGLLTLFALVGGLAILGGVRIRGEEPAAAADVDYVRDVRPLLEKQCYECHGADKQQAGLRVDTAQLAITGGDGGPAVLPGNSDESRLLQAVRGTSDEISQMPLDGDPLSAAEIDILRRWIDAGAQHPADEVADSAARVTSDHWSFQPLVRPDIPAVAHRECVQNAVDAFIQARLEAEGIAPSPEADRNTLIRRVYLDLLGILPVPEEVQAFLADDGRDAYERMVDRAFASPHYGERWGRHWLDAARYADSNGFALDGARSMWPYRDWVVAAINDDMPFDEFTVEQLAGDLLPHPTTAQVIATGFHRNTLANEEGGTDDEQFRVESVVDRVGTTSTVWLGLTVACAQCHDHKFDPIAQRDFYRMFAVFNSTADNNDADDLAPKLEFPTATQAAERDRLDAEVAAATALRTAVEQAHAPHMTAWEAELATREEPDWIIVHPLAYSSPNGTAFELLVDASLLPTSEARDRDVYEIEFPLPAGGVAGVMLEALTHESLPKGGPGRARNGNFILTEVEFETRSTADPADRAPTKFVDALADHSQENYPVRLAVDGEAGTGWAINVRKGNPNVPRTATFVLANPVTAVAGRVGVIRLRQEGRSKQYLLGRFRLSLTGRISESLRLTPVVLEIVMTPAAERSKEQQELVTRAFHTSLPAWRTANARVDKLQQQLASFNGTIARTLVMQELDHPRDSFVHVRGDFLRKGARVFPGVPAVLPGLPDDVQHATRLDVARWLVTGENPLTARVIANRAWQRFFGMGLVETENDFGLQGSPPSHPQLLDWLASELIDGDWSMKSLHREIVTSAAYRRESHVRDDLALGDPRNKLLARQSRIRLDAEVVRDACLAASGMLSEKMQGPPVRPPQPEGIYRFTQNAKPWVESTGEDRYRRGMYTQFWRSSPHPLMPTFDAPDANSACTRRVRSNTPLQALTLANDRGFVELSQGFALRILREAPPYDDGRLRFAFQCTLDRDPQAEELSRLSEFLAQQRAYWGTQTAAAEAAPAPVALPVGVDAAEGAAWTAVARVLLNLDEFITRE